MKLDDKMKVKRSPVYEQVFNYMKDAIKNGQWNINEKIPSEIELSESFGVNRLTVRMALQRLIGMGLLEVSPGDGTYVRKFSFRGYMESASDFFLNTELLDKVREFRNTIELECARLAINNATEAELSELDQICSKFEMLRQSLLKDESDETFTDTVNCDVEFHYQVCSMSHNDLFVYSFEMALGLIYQYIEENLKERVRSWKQKGHSDIIWYDFHRDIYEGIAKKDFEICKKAYMDNIDYKLEL